VNRTKRTPGPWTAVDLGGNHYAVAEQSTGIGLLFNEANSRLLAAAPDLLAALEDWVRLEDEGPSKSGISLLSLYQRARAAIRKAEGGAA